MTETITNRGGKYFLLKLLTVKAVLHNHCLISLFFYSPILEQIMESELTHLYSRTFNWYLLQTWRHNSSSSSSRGNFLQVLEFKQLLLVILASIELVFSGSFLILSTGSTKCNHVSVLSYKSALAIIEYVLDHYGIQNNLDIFIRCVSAYTLFFNSSGQKLNIFLFLFFSFFLPQIFVKNMSFLINSFVVNRNICTLIKLW